MCETQDKDVPGYARHRYINKNGAPMSKEQRDALYDFWANHSYHAGQVIVSVKHWDGTPKQTKSSF